MPILTNELLLGICTTEPISCGEAVVEIHMAFKDSCSKEHDQKLSVPLVIVDAEEIDDAQLVIDEEVIRRVKERDDKLAGRPPEKVTDNGFLDCTPTKVVRYNPYYRSALEELYRVEGTHTLER